MVSILKEETIEIKILHAARKVFIQKGLEGATLQEIADEAEISRTSLHYYFRSKEKLFEAFFELALREFLPRINDIIEMDISIQKKIELFVEAYTDVLLANQFLPIFIMQELRRNPDYVINKFKNEAIFINVTKLQNQFAREIMEGNMRPFQVPDFVSNLIGMCLFPFLAKPVFEELFFEHNEEAFVDFMQRRKKEIISTMINWLKPVNN